MSEKLGRLECPECGEQLWEDQQRVFLKPVSRYTWCKNDGCGYEGRRTLGSVRVLHELPEPPPETA